jgi:hypothetical protein
MRIAKLRNDPSVVTTVESYLFDPVLLNKLTEKVYELLKTDIKYQQ